MKAGPGETWAPFSFMALNEKEVAPHLFTPMSAREWEEAKKYANGEWALLRYDSEMELATYIRRTKQPNGKVKLDVREMQNVTQITDENKHLANSWTGWSGKKNGAVVARIPIATYQKLQRECGFDGFEYDRAKMKKILNDGDNAALRTGGGKL